MDHFESPFFGKICVFCFYFWRKHFRCLFNFIFYRQIPMQLYLGSFQHYHLNFRRNYSFSERFVIPQYGVVTDVGMHRSFRLGTCSHMNWIVESLILILGDIDSEFLKDQDNGIIPTKIPTYWYRNAVQYIWIPPL